MHYYFRRMRKALRAYLHKYTLPFIAAAEHPSNIHYPTGFLKIVRKRLPGSYKREAFPYHFNFLLSFTQQ